MSHTILSLFADSFDTRAVCFGGCLININGETRDCVVSKDNAHLTSPTYTVRDTDSHEELCTFRPYHLGGGPYFYEIEGASRVGGDATLIVPNNLLRRRDEEDEDTEERIDEGSEADDCIIETSN